MSFDAVGAFVMTKSFGFKVRRIRVLGAHRIA
jgi:hypothetical protein